MAGRIAWSSCACQRRVLSRNDHGLSLCFAVRRSHSGRGRVVKAVYHDTDIDTDTDSPDTPIHPYVRHARFPREVILARMSVSWNAGLTAPASECTNYILWLRRSVCGRPSCNNCHSFQPLFESIRHCGLRYDGHPLRCCGHPPRAFVARIASTARCARCGLAYCCRCHCHM